MVNPVMTGNEGEECVQVARAEKSGFLGQNRRAEPHPEEGSKSTQVTSWFLSPSEK